MVQKKTAREIYSRAGDSKAEPAFQGDFGPTNGDSCMIPPAASGGNGQAALRQPSLFPPPDIYQADVCASRHGGVETSREAHERIRPFKREIYDKILTIIRSRGDLGATVHELAESIDTFPSSISGRLFELRIQGELDYLVDTSGNRVKRRGAYALVLVAKGN